MPSPKDKSKLTGNTHLPDIDEGTQDEQSGQAANETRQSSGGGEIKDKEAETSNSYGNTRDSGERPTVSRKNS
jgi:hypothetical protein